MIPKTAPLVKPRIGRVVVCCIYQNNKLPGFVAKATTPRQSSFDDKQQTKTGGGGIRNPKVPLTTPEQTSHKSTTKPPQQQTDKDFTNSVNEQNNTDSQQNHNNSLQQKCAICVHQGKNTIENLPADLAEIVAVWPKLPEHIKRTIQVLVRSV